MNPILIANYQGQFRIHHRTFRIHMVLPLLRLEKDFQIVLTFRIAGGQFRESLGHSMYLFCGPRVVRSVVAGPVSGPHNLFQLLDRPTYPFSLSYILTSLFIRLSTLTVHCLSYSSHVCSLFLSDYKYRSTFG